MYARSLVGERLSPENAYGQFARYCIAMWGVCLEVVAVSCVECVLCAVYRETKAALKHVPKLLPGMRCRRELTARSELAEDDLELSAGEVVGKELICNGRSRDPHRRDSCVMREDAIPLSPRHCY